MNDQELTKVRRRLASSGNVSYGDAIVIHDSTRTRVTFVPYFIPRTSHTELAVKLQTHKKRRPPDGFALVEDKSISLKEPAAKKLLEALSKHLAVAGQDSDGTYLILRLGDQVTDIGNHDPAQIASALGKVLSRSDIARHLEAKELSDELLSSLRAAIKLKEMQDAVATLRQHLDAGTSDEQTYQRWCQEHAWAFGNAYVVNDHVRSISATDNIDILLPTVIAGYRDLVELKRPDMDVLRFDAGHKNYYWSSEVSRAIGQCHRYLDVLHEVAANGLRDHPEVVAYHPRAIIVIGRSADWSDAKLRALHGLNHRLNSVTVMTYDQLLAQGERLSEILCGEPDDKDDQASDWSTSTDWDDPF